MTTPSERAFTGFLNKARPAYTLSGELALTLRTKHMERVSTTTGSASAKLDEPDSELMFFVVYE